MLRWITGIIAALAVVALIEWGPNWLVKAVIGLITAVASGEGLLLLLKKDGFFVNSTGADSVAGKNKTHFIFLSITVVFSFLIIFFPYAVFLFAPLIAICVLVFHYDLEQKLSLIRNFTFVALFILLPLFMISLLTYQVEGMFLPFKYFFKDRFWLYVLLIGTFMGDTGAYLSGKLIGGPKIAPKISPGKTWAGFFGGVLVSFAANHILLFFFDPPSYFLFAIAAVLIPLVAFWGDLFESLLKRVVGVKDSSNLMPGHGGILDRIDGLLFSGPFLVMYLALLEYIQISKALNSI